MHQRLKLSANKSKDKILRNRLMYNGYAFEYNLKVTVKMYFGKGKQTPQFYYHLNRYVNTARKCIISTKKDNNAF